MYNGQNMFNLDITQDSLSKYLRDRYANRPLIFEDRPCLLDEFIVELRIRNFIAIGDLHKILERTKNAAERFESENPPSSLKDSLYSAIGIARTSMMLLDNDFFTFRRTVVDNCPPERLERYRKLIPPETDKSQSTAD